jgi:hypothetical protein
VQDCVDFCLLAKVKRNKVKQSSDQDLKMHSVEKVQSEK